MVQNALFPNGVSQYAIGGVFIGLGVAVIYLGTGIIAGASTFLESTLSYVSDVPRFQKPKYVASRDWRVLFTLGMVGGAAVYQLAFHGGLWTTQVEWWRLLGGGFLVGVGTRLGKGCTSGHGVCGVGSRVVHLHRQRGDVHGGGNRRRTTDAGPAGDTMSGQSKQGGTLFHLLIVAGGLLFGFGLGFSHMAQPEVVLHFLQFKDFGLLFVMGGAAVVTGTTFAVATRLSGRAPLTGKAYTRRLKSFDRNVIIGGVIFGAGWGLSGICPGAAYASIGIGDFPILFAIGGMFLGAYAQGLWRKLGASEGSMPSQAD